MMIFMSNMFLAFAFLCIPAELNAVEIQRVSWRTFHVEPNNFDEEANRDRVFNEGTTFENPRNERYHRKIVTVVNDELVALVTFAIQEDRWGRLVDVQKEPRNITPRPHRILTTHLATLGQVQFLVHVNNDGFIVGARPPPRQPRRQESHSPSSSFGSTGSAGSTGSTGTGSTGITDARTPPRPQRREESQSPTSRHRSTGDP